MTNLTTVGNVSAEKTCVAAHPPDMADLPIIAITMIKVVRDLSRKVNVDILYLIYCASMCI